MPEPKKKLPLRQRIREALSVFRQVPGTLALLRHADLPGTILLGVFSVVLAGTPVAIAWIGKLIIDGVVLASKTGLAADREHVAWLVGLELGVVAAQMGLTRIASLQRELTGAKLGFDINVRILEKALTLELRHFEDSEIYDKMQNARREASSRPLSLAMEVANIVEQLITLGAYGVLLLRLSPVSVAVLVVAAIPAFIAEARLSGESFRIYSWRAPEARKLNYLEWILTRDSHVKEVKLFDLGALFLGRYQSLYAKFYKEDRRLAIKRAVQGTALGFVSLAAFYACYVGVAGRAARSEISLGDMAFYIAAFREGQAAIRILLQAIGSMYEDSLFMSNLFLFFAIPTAGERSRAKPALIPAPGPATLELKNVSFKYPGKEEWALRNLSLRIAPGEKLALVGDNGAGKSTLIKLLMRLYEPTEGEIFWNGVDLRDMDVRELRGRVAAVNQDFVRYQLSVAENIGLGDVARLEDRPRIEQAASAGGAVEVIDTLPQKYETTLGGWFERGQELSAGQWQKLAVARAFMRDADVLILDEPTASIDAEAEAALFERFRNLSANRTAIVISHRFSTVRIADRIAVLRGGAIEEIGSHKELLAKDGRYAALFRLQAKGYLD